jgi:hypothetical protein
VKRLSALAVVVLAGIFAARVTPPYHFLESDGKLWRVNRWTGSAAWTAPSANYWHYTASFDPNNPFADLPDAK